MQTLEYIGPPTGDVFSYLSGVYPADAPFDADDATAASLLQLPSIAAAVQVTLPTQPEPPPTVPAP
jgi:hypothetical protein